MKRSNQRQPGASNPWTVAWRRHRDGKRGVLQYTGAVHIAVEALQAKWLKADPGLAIGLTYQVVCGGLVDAEFAASRLGAPDGET